MKQHAKIQVNRMYVEACVFCSDNTLYSLYIDNTHKLNANLVMSFHCQMTVIGTQ